MSQSFTNNINILAGTKHPLTSTPSTTSDVPSKKSKSDHPEFMSLEATRSTSSATSKSQENLVGGSSKMEGRSGSGSAGRNLERFGKELEGHLTCGVCSDLYHRPVAMIPCLHVYCGACAVTWLKSHRSCPTCRKVVHKTTDSHSTIQMLDMFSALRGKSIKELGTRTIEELATMDAKYTAGTKIHISSSDGDDYEDTDYAGTEDEDEDYLDGLGSEATYHNPCPCCDPNNSLGFVCPTPIPPQTYLLVSAVEGHGRCDACRSNFPKRTVEERVMRREWSGEIQDELKEVKEYVCVGCDKEFCPESMGTCTGLNKLRKLRGQELSLFGGHHVSEFYSKMGRFELNLMTDALNEHYGGVKNILKEYFQTVDDFTVDINNRGNRSYFPEDRLCVECAQSMLLNDTQNQIRSWWSTEYDMLAEEDKLPEAIKRRQKCWYGYECRTQNHNPGHAERLRHCCNEIPPEERRRESATQTSEDGREGNDASTAQT